jgi:DNA-binding NarL/FixJ family response regulator
MKSRALPSTVAAESGVAAEPASPPASVRLVLAEAHPITLEAMERLVRDAGFSVLETCTRSDVAIRAVLDHRPDVVVIDGALPPDGGLAAIKDLQSRGVPSRFVLLSSADAEADLVEAARHGVHGVVLKEMPTHFLVECIRKVQRGEQWVEKRSVGNLLETLVRREVATRQLALDLTPRELDIVRLVTRGLRNRAIGEQLGIEEGTVKIHLHNIYKKLGIAGRLALTLYARERGYL